VFCCSALFIRAAAISVFAIEVAAVSLFFLAVAHELRTPVSGWLIAALP
jgi:hypothetical protein